MATAPLNDGGFYEPGPPPDDPAASAAEVMQHTGDGSVDMHGMPSLKSSSGNWRTCPFVLGTEFCERLAFYGINQNLVTYLTTKLHFGNAAAAKTVTNFAGTSYLTALLGALPADTYWGKYRTIAVFSTIYFIGMATLTLSVSISAFQGPSSGIDDGICPEASILKYGVFFCALYLVALATGGMKPCVPAFGADQFDDTDSKERKSKGSFFNWFYFAIFTGSIFASTVVVWVQDNVEWGWGYLILTGSMALAIISFFSGTPIYRFQKLRGSPITRLCQVIVASFSNWHRELPQDDSLLYEDLDKHSAIQGGRKLEHTNDFRCLDKAAIVTAENTPMLGFRNPWKLCDVTQIEELKILIRLFPIWITSIAFSSVWAQMSSVFVEQAMFMDSRIGSFKIPPASLSLFNQLSFIVWVPIYDRIIVPLARKHTGQEGGFTQLQRIGIGLVISIFAMAVAAIVETVRLDIARHENLIHEATPVPMSVFWQIPQYSLIGAAEVFTSIGLLELFYDQAPDSMRSICTAFPYLSGAAGDYLSTLIVTITTALSSRGGKPGWISDNLNEGHLNYYFSFLAILCLFNWLAYIACACNFKYKKARRYLILNG